MARIIFESNKCNNIELEERDITIDDNGTYAITPNVGYAGMSKVDVNVGVDTLQGLNFAGVYDAEQANEINQYYKDGIEYAKEIKRNWVNATSLERAFNKDTRIRYFPNVLFDGVLYVDNMFGWSTIEYFPKSTLPNVVTATGMFYNCARLKELDINLPLNTNLNYFLTNANSLISLDLHDVSRVTTWIDFLTQITPNFLRKIKFENWKKGSISFGYLSNLIPESIHYTIQNAMDVADGAMARTLTLHATAKTNWMNSKYYEQDEITRIAKGIEIA